jgi:hypothetical protein
MSNEVAKSESHAPAVVASGMGFEGVSQDDLIVPRLKIVQPTSQEGTAGTFRDTVSGEESATLEDVVVLKMTKARRLFEDSDLRCASDDMLKPRGSIADPIHSECATCPLAVWTTVDGKRTPPKCAETWNFLVVHEGLPYYMTFHGAAMTNVRKFITAITLRAAKLKANLFDFVMTLELDEKKFDKGRAYMPVFSNLRVENDEENKSINMEFYKTFASEAKTVEEDPTDFEFGDNA